MRRHLRSISGLKILLKWDKGLAFISSNKATRSPHPFVDALMIEKTQELQQVTLEIGEIVNRGLRYYMLRNDCRVWGNNIAFVLPIFLHNVKV